MFFSIIVPVYNAEKYLRQCIDSILNQTYRNFEVFLVNDGSQDRSGQICCEYSNRDSRIHVIHKLNEGVVLARQNGVVLAKGDYFIFVDADDFISDVALERINAVLEEYRPDIAAYGTYVETPKGIQKQVLHGVGMYNKKEIERDIFPYLIQTDTCDYFPPYLVTKAFRNQLYRAHPCEDKEILIGEDAAGTIACMFHADSLFIMEDCLYHYRYNEESVTRSRRVHSWNCAKRIADFLDREIDLSVGDLREQVLRYVVHMIFITACSQFGGKEGYMQTVRSIQENISDPFYAAAIRNCKFRFLSNGWLAQFALKHKCYWLMKIWNGIR